MASDKGKKIAVEDDDGDEAVEDLERFDDFTIASSWERFISEIEAVCRLWMADGPKNLLVKGASQVGSLRNLFKMQNELKYNGKSYSIDYYFRNDSIDDHAEWIDHLHKLQLSFGVKEFMVIAPLSVSGVVLDIPEATKLLSSVAIALSNCGSMWPAFVPVHDPSRNAYIGIQNLGTVFTRRFEADRIGSQVPVKLMHLEGLYELFISKFAFSVVDFSTSFFKVHFSMKLMYRTPPYDEEEEDVQKGESEVKDPSTSDDNVRIKIQWDDDCPWTEWYSAEDPLRNFELTVLWSSRVVESSLDMAELENASLFEAEKWLLLPVLSSNVLVGSDKHTAGFASQLKLLVNAFDMSFSGQFMEDFISVERQNSEAVKSSSTVPPPSVLDRVLKDIFHEENEILSYGMGEHKNSRGIKGAPLESLFAQFCLHSLWFGSCNINALAMLWIEFVREVRWFWEESQPLPRMLSNCGIDLSTCLIHQKLQMLAICIVKLRAENHDLHNEKNDRSESAKLSGQDRKGSAGFAESMMLLNSHERMHVPYTQDALIMTEDMHEERMQALAALGNSSSFAANLEKDVLSSDMSAFKAANPAASFEDFIRWHSPGDWEDEQNPTSADEKIGSLSCDSWPPRGRLSQRMSEGGNSWRQIWNTSPALPVSKQKPLFDPNREGEKILHYLETLRPDQLLGQMICTAFRASADTLNQTLFGDLKEMETKISQLYLTIGSTLKPLRANHVPDKVEFVNDVNRLCVLFGHIELLLTVAASIHRKLLHVPRLCKAIFLDIYNFYIPRLGQRLVESSDDVEFKEKQMVGVSERDVITNLFPPPTANQSWRKVLSMGNLLNGHEPITREIMFSVYNSMSGNHYGTSNPWGYSSEVKTHRMYISCTSNDLQVALSVTSCD